MVGDAVAIVEGWVVVAGGIGFGAFVVDGLAGGLVLAGLVTVPSGFVVAPFDGLFPEGLAPVAGKDGLVEGTATGAGA